MSAPGTAPDVVYHGWQQQAGGSVITIEDATGETTGVVRHVVKHSPTGIGWGYAGSGPADCARSLLIAAVGPPAKCPACTSTRRCGGCDEGYLMLPYQAFKFEFVCGWGQEWRMSRHDILQWLAQRDVFVFEDGPQ